MSGMLRLVCVCLLALSAPALALDDPDTEVARRHFEKGRGFYDAHDYRRALDEFQAAKRAKAAPGLDYNIARCYDRLEEYDHAVEHYQLFLGARPDSPDAGEIRDRIATLKKRLAESPQAKEKTVVEAHPSPEVHAPPSEAPLLLATPALDGALAPSNEELDRARRRRNGAIVGGILGGAVVIGAIVLGVLLSRPQPAGSLTRSDLGPFTVTP
jgi:tetratricopeptide (TPR) repeat protein